MSDQAWVLQGVDPDLLKQAEVEAERRGISLSDYLTEALFAETLGRPAAEAGLEGFAALLPPAEPNRENFALRHRLDALERRLGVAVNGLENALATLDAHVAGMAAQLDETDAGASALGQALTVAMNDVSGQLAAIRKRLADAEEASATFGADSQAAHEDLSRRCDAIAVRLAEVETLARQAEAAGASLRDAHEALQRALAEDFNDFALDTDRRLDAAAETARALAEDAARRADEAVARALDTLRATRESLERSVADQAADTRARMQAAFGDAAERLAALAERLLENERALVRSDETLSARIADVEDAAQAALEETAGQLRREQAALAHRLDRAQRENQDALQSADARQRADLQKLRDETRSSLAAAELEYRDGLRALDLRLDDVREQNDAAIAELTERHLGALARLQLVDGIAAGAANDVAVLAASVDTRFGEMEVAAQAQRCALETELAARCGALNDRLGDAERRHAQLEQSTAADIDRVETCTFAALEKLAQDLRAGDAEQTRALASLEERQTGALARLSVIESAVRGLEAETAPLAARIAALEQAVQNADTEEALAGLRGAVDGLAGEIAALRRVDIDQRLAGLQRRFEQDVAALAVQVDALAGARSGDDELMRQVEELRTRLAQSEGQVRDAGDRAHGVARLLARVTAQVADVSTQSEERLHKLELALADLRLESAGAASAHDAASEIESRLAALERRQGEALASLRAALGDLDAEYARRFAALEQRPAAPDADALIANAVEARLTALEQRGLNEDFDALRRRIEDRILSVETRSVRALEQVAETVALIERRFGADAETTGTLSSAQRA